MKRYKTQPKQTHRLLTGLLTCLLGLSGTGCTPFPQCTTDSDCTVPLVCDTQRNACKARCTQDADCAADQRCSNLRCLSQTLADGGPAEGGSTQLSAGLLAYLQKLRQHIQFKTNTQGQTTSITIAGQLTLQLERKVVQVHNANLQILNGQGKTDSDNGLGNLLVGYNETGQLSNPQRKGSHNVIIGSGHEYVSHGGFVAGNNNTLSGPFSSILGGQNNTAISEYSSILGGQGNTANKSYSTISGGQGNNTQGRYSSILGGNGNSTQNPFSSISGGKQNKAEGDYSSILGGKNVTVNQNDEVAIGTNQSGGACLTRTLCK